MKYILSALLVCFATTGIAASKSYDMNFGQMASNADLVFAGEVVNVQYKQSKAVKGQPSLPHTFVTYEVHDVLHGSYRGKQITLRFLGGLAKNDQIMMVSHAPKFDVGDQDILFVHQNTQSECPLVGCADGRLRLIGDAVYTEQGNKLMQDEKGIAFAGASEQLKEISTFTIGNKQFEQRASKTQSKDPVGEETAIQQSSAAAQISSGSLSGLIKAQVYSANSRDPYGDKKLAVSANALEEFSLAPMKAVAISENLIGEKHHSLSADEQHEIELEQQAVKSAR